jgi:hypothetical protein
MSPSVALGAALIIYALSGCTSRAAEERPSSWMPAPPQLRGSRFENSTVIGGAIHTSRGSTFKDSYLKSTIVHTSGDSPTKVEGTTIDDSFVFMRDGGFYVSGDPGAPDGARGNDSYINGTAIVEETTRPTTPDQR